ncbi:MAG: M23 family metallopeptidase, partial [Pseudomonadota bacterium]
KPVRGGNVRFTSGFGMRRHPILNRLRPHRGIDWAARSGTPIMAAGNGTVSFAGRRGAFGNLARIRHANGYETAYAHMQRFARGIKADVQVRQGDIIGYVGTTGLSSGPHLHFEVRVNGRHVDPLKIKVGRERNLSGRELSDFQRERERIMSVMRSPPVRTNNR